LSRATTPIITPVLNTVTPTIVQGGPTNVQGEHVQKNPIIIPGSTILSGRILYLRSIKDNGIPV
jgi:hypothetical protein